MELKNDLELNTSEVVSKFERAVKKFELKKKIFRILSRGKGLEFEAYRKFEQDEDYSVIDWKATMRAGGDLMTRQYKEEREIDVYFLVDAGESMKFGSGKKLKAEIAGEAICSLAHVSLTSGDRVGLILYSDKSMKVLPSKNSKNQFFLFKKFLSDKNSYGGNFDLASAINFSFRFVKRSQSLIFVIVSDFIHIKKGFEKQLKILANKGEVVALMVRDPLDNALPKLSAELIIQDPHSSRQMVIDPKVASEQFAINALYQKQFVRDLFKKSAVDFLELNASEDFIAPLVGFLKSRSGRSI
jgi:uncharacterized protein (DUF58 family)